MKQPLFHKLPNGKVQRVQRHPMMQFLDDSEHDTLDPQLPATAPSRVPTGSGQPHQVPELSALDGSEVVILGAGSVGSYVAYFMAGAFQAVVYLIDFDTVEAKNTQSGRSLYTPGSIGARKVYAAREFIESDFPHSKVVPLPYNIMEVPDGELIRLARRCGVVINAIDDPTAMLRVNALLYSRIQVLYPALHNGAKTGHIILTIPGKSACLRCSMEIEAPDEIQTLHGEPGSGLDIRNVANHCANLACQLMEAQNQKQDIEEWDLEKTIFYFSNARNHLSPDGPGILLQAAQKRAGCPVCSL